MGTMYTFNCIQIQATREIVKPGALSAILKTIAVKVLHPHPRSQITSINSHHFLGVLDNINQSGVRIYC